MILVDTSVWVDHLKGRAPARPLPDLLEGMEVLTHPFVLGELVLEGLAEEARHLLELLPKAQIASHEEALHLVDEHRLTGRGIGWVDTHLLASARLSRARLWTLDRQLGSAATDLTVGWPP